MQRRNLRRTLKVHRKFQMPACDSTDTTILEAFISIFIKEIDRLSHSARAMVLMVIVIATSALSLDCIMAKSEYDRDQILDLILQQLYTEKYDSALTNCRNMQELWPNDPTAIVLQMNIYQTLMRTYRVRIFETKLDSLIKGATELIKKQIRKKPTAELLFLKGTSSGIQALQGFRQGNWIGALKSGLIAIRAMEEALNRDATFVDAKLAIGLYKFWKSEKLDFGIGLQRNQRKRALELIEEVWKNGRYLSIDAAFSFQNVLLHEGEYSRGLEINDWLKNRYPHHVSVLYHRALLLENLHRSSEALQYWDNLIIRIQSFQVQSNGYLAECYLHRAEIYGAMSSNHGDKLPEIEKAVAQALFYAKNRDAANETESSYQKFDDIYDSIKKLKKRYAVQETKG